MDTLRIISDTLSNNMTVHTHALIYKVDTFSSHSDSFFKMDNPFWYILTILISGYFTYILSRVSKKKEAINEAKKLFLDKRINAHQKLYEILSDGLLTTNVTQGSDKIFYRIFSSKDEFNDWFDKLLTFAGQNKPYLSISVNKDLNLINRLRKNIDFLFTNNPYTDGEVKEFAIKYHDELSGIFKSLEKSIVKFFEKEITLDYKFGRLTKKDFDENKNKLLNYKIITDFQSK